MELPESFDVSTFGGFNKKTVLKYIDELCERAKNTEDELNAKIEEKEAECKSLKERIEALETTAAKHHEVKMTLEETIAELDRELRRQRSVAETYERELGEQKEQLRQLAVRAEGWESKSRKYDEAMSQIGGALMDARQGAAAVTKAAEQKAARITTAAVEAVQNLATQVGGFKGDITMLRKALQMTMAELARRLDDLDLGIAKLGCSVDEQLTSYNFDVQTVEKAFSEQELNNLPEVEAQPLLDAQPEPNVEPETGAQPAEEAAVSEATTPSWEVVDEDAEPLNEPKEQADAEDEPKKAAAAPRFFW